ncbi:MAG: response regulator transcription factor, partial [Chloroflexota bacterium]
TIAGVGSGGFGTAERGHRAIARRFGDGGLDPGRDAEQCRDPFDLTERELEVLRLIAAGWSNQQIADSLFISRKTASVHASHIFDKLGAANRVDAAAIAHRLGVETGPPPPGSTTGRA